MEIISTKKLIRNAFKAIIRPHKAFKEIPKNKKVNYRIIVPLTFVWGGIFIFLNFSIAQNNWFFQWGHSSITLFNGSVYGFLLWFAGSILFYYFSRIFKKNIPFKNIEIAVFYLWLIWAIMPFFDLPHLIFKIPMWSIFGIGIHFSWFFAFPFFIISGFFLLKDVLKFKNRELILAVFFSFFLPFGGRFILEEIPTLLNEFLKLFDRPMGYHKTALLGVLISFVLFYLLYRIIIKQISFKKFVIAFPCLLSIVIFSWTGLMYFTPLGKIPTRGPTLSFFNISTGDFGLGKSYYTHSFTWISSDYETGTPTHRAGDSSSYYSDSYVDSVDLDFNPASTTINEIRVKVSFTSATQNNQGGNGPRAQGCFASDVNGSAGTYYCSSWTTNLSGASNQTFTISSSTIYTYAATGDGSAAGAAQWNALVAAMTQLNNDALVHSWCEGDGDANVDSGDQIAFNVVTVEIDYEANLIQKTYRWYSNADSVQPGGALAAENSEYSGATSTSIYRLRMAIEMETGYTATLTEQYKLQFGTTTGTCATGVSSWVDVGNIASSTIWRGADNATPTDGSQIAFSLLDSQTNALETYEEQNISALNPAPILTPPRGEWDWVVQNNGAVKGTGYCFRMVESSGTVLYRYSNYPKITTKGVVISGIAYEDEGSTVWTGCDNSTQNISLVIGGIFAASTTCSSTSGYFAFSDRYIAPDSEVSVFFNTNGGNTDKGVAIIKMGTLPDDLTLNPRNNRVWITTESGVSDITNTDLDHCDSGTPSACSNVPYSVSSGNLTVESSAKLVIESNKSFVPGGTVTLTKGADQTDPGGDLLITQGATLGMETYSLSVGGDFENQGTFSKSSTQTTTFTATSSTYAIYIGNSSFENITFSGTGGTFQFTTTTQIDADLTMTSGTLTGTSSITVLGGDATGNGTINLTSGTFTLDGTGYFGGNTSWIFNNLTFGDGSGAATTSKTGSGNIEITNVLTIAANQKLQASSQVWTLSGSGNPFLVSGILEAQSSVFKYTASSDATSTATIYYQLEFAPGSGSPTFYLGSGTFTINNHLYIGDGTNSLAVVANVNNPTLDIVGDFEIRNNATFTASGSGGFSVGGNWLNSGNFFNASSTVVFDAQTTGKTINTGGSGNGQSFYSIDFNSSSGGWTVTNDLLAENNFYLTNATSFSVSSTDPGWYDSDWLYRKKITIASSTGAGTNYQVELQIGYSSGGDVTCDSNCETNFDDIFFTDDNGITPLDFWLESYATSATSTFWVEVQDDLSTTSQDIYMYYGNSGASSASNGENTFLFFDDFPGSSLDTNKWDTVSGSPPSSYSVENGYLKMWSNWGGECAGAGIYNRLNTYKGFTVPIVVESRFSVSGTDAIGNTNICYHTTLGGRDVVGISGGSTYGNVFKIDATSTGYVETFPAKDTWYRISKYYETGQLRAVTDYGINNTFSGSVIASGVIGVTGDTDAAEANMSDRVDWIAVRKYVSSEPSFSSASSQETEVSIDHIVIEVRGEFNNSVGGTAITWNNSTLYLNGFSSIANTKAEEGDIYSVLRIAANTHVRMWNSYVEGVTGDSSGSLYSMDHDLGGDGSGDDGRLYIWGNYTVATSQTEYWSYSTDFDETALTGGYQRQCEVIIGKDSSITVGSGETLQIIGDASYPTLISGEASQNYSLDISGGEINAYYYEFDNIDCSGLNIGAGSTVTELSEGNFDNAGPGTDCAYIAIASSSISEEKSFTNNVFDDESDGADGNADYNVLLNGHPDYFWYFTSHSGYKDGEAFDSDPGDASPGYIRWDDSPYYIPRSKNWRWYHDQNNETPSDAADLENSAPTNIAQGNILKLRMSIAETGGDVGSDLKMRLQYSTSSVFSSFVYVGEKGAPSSVVWSYADGIDSDNDPLSTTTLSDAEDVATHNESGISTSSLSQSIGSILEWEFTIQNNGAPTSTTYYFRAYENTNATTVEKDDGELYPSLVTGGGTLTLNVSGLPSGTTTEGIDTDVTTTAVSVPFGELQIGQEIEAAHRLTVTTNAEGGYQIFIYQDQDLISSGGEAIDAIPYTNESPASWPTDPSPGGYGYHAGDDTLSNIGDGTARFAPNDTYAAFENNMKEIAFSPIYVNSETTDCIFKAEITSLQEAGDYENRIIYILVPIF